LFLFAKMSQNPVDIEYALESPGPGHCDVSFSG
jgi:hypothetical protein